MIILVLFLYPGLITARPPLMKGYMSALWAEFVFVIIFHFYTPLFFFASLATFFLHMIMLVVLIFFGPTDHCPNLIKGHMSALWAEYVFVTIYHLHHCSSLAGITQVGHDRK